MEYSASSVTEPKPKTNRIATPVSEQLTGLKLQKWREQMFAAVQSNDSGRLGDLILENDNANFKVYSPVNPDLFTYPLHFALQHDLMDSASFIINEMVFDPNVRDSYDHTALSITIERYDFRNFRDLLDKSDLKVQVRGGLGLIHFAASMDTPSNIFLQSLARKEVDFTAKCGKRGWTALKYAAVANNLVLAKWIIENTPDNLSLPANEDILLDALKSSREEISIALLTWGANFRCTDSKNRNIVHIAAREGLIKVLDQIPLPKNEIQSSFLSSRDSKGFCPVHLAAERNQVDVIEYLACNFDLKGKTSDGLSVIQVAISSGSAEVVRLLFQKDLFDYIESFHGDAFPPVLVMAYKSLEGHYRKLDVLISILDSFKEKYDDSEDRRYLHDEFGLNILHYAVKENDMKLIQILVENYEFDVNFMENSCEEIQANSPLAWAIYSRMSLIVKYLFENGASPEERVKLILFTPEDFLNSEDDPFDQDDAMDLFELAEIFGGEEIVEIMRQYTYIGEIMKMHK
ncbi:ankyrin repeat domain containing protein [Perkinsus sp. BL_2016]|nr:ankyrin repeat domain containing protein [Perkinsus sp. BL_2016]